MAYLILLTLNILSFTAFGGAFRLSFFESDNCAGELVGTWIGGEGQGCNTGFVGVAEGVVVQSTGAVDDKTQVRFFSSPDCRPGTEISETNGGCIIIDDELIGAYGSYQVVADVPAEVSAKKRRSPSERRSLFQTTDINDVSPPIPSVIHGQLGTFDNIEYKWWQVGATAWLGILPSEWDDDIHVKIDDVLEDFTSESFGSVDNKTLAVRDLDDRGIVQIAQGLCEIGLSCLQTAHGIDVKLVAADFLTTAATFAKSKGKDLFELLTSAPFISQLLANVASGYPNSLVAAKISGDTTTVLSCTASDPTAHSLLQSQIDLVQSLISLQLNSITTVTSAVTIVVHVNDAGDEVASFTMSANSCGGINTADGCGMTTGFCG